MNTEEKITRFPNKAGDNRDNDDVLRAELKAAGITTIQEHEGKPPGYMAEIIRRTSGEVVTGVMGLMCGWEFKRSWYYWVASGPGIPIETAERLNEKYGTHLRVNGFAGGADPREMFGGFGVGSYHIDSHEGLKALADVLKEIKASSDAIVSIRKK